LPVLAILAAGCALATGCGGAPFAMAPVGGTLSYDDGSKVPGDRIVVTFVPQGIEAQGKAAAGAGRVEVDPATGQFETATTWKPRDGVLIGKHKVMVEAFKTGPYGHSIPNGAVSADYSRPDTTPLEIVIPKGGDTNLSLKVSKPKRR
jgi:hypothetical protein